MLQAKKHIKLYVFKSLKHNYLFLNIFVCLFFLYTIRRADRLENELKAVKRLNLELLQRIELLETQNAQLRALDKAIKTKKVIPLFKDL